MKSFVVAAAALFMAAMIATPASARPGSDQDDRGEARGHSVTTIFVDWQAAPKGDGSRQAPYQVKP